VCLNPDLKPRDPPPNASQSPANTAKTPSSNRFQAANKANPQESRPNTENFTKFLGIGLSDLDKAKRNEVLGKFPRTERFKEDIIQAFYAGIRHKPATTFGNIKADVLADKDPQFKRINFCTIIRESAWQS
jgi:hypothetical protein